MAHPGESVSVLCYYEEQQADEDGYDAGCHGSIVVRLASVRLRRADSALACASETSATDEVDDRVFEYRYDSLDRVDTAWRHPVGSTTHGEDWDYGYHDASNITRRVHDSTTTHFAYTANNQLCWTAATGSGNACDNAPSGAAGNVIRDQDYDPYGSVIGATSKAATARDLPSRAASPTPPPASTTSGRSGRRSRRMRRRARRAGCDGCVRPCRRENCGAGRWLWEWLRPS